MKCIYCETSLNGSGETSVSSKEHVIQEALGGTGETTTTDCCKICNSNLGTEIDAPFVDSFLMKMLRVRHEIKSKKGKLPSISFDAQSTSMEKDTVVTLTAGPELDISIKPQVDRRKINENSEVINVSASPQMAEEIYKGILRKGNLKGQILRTTSGDVLSNLTEVLDSGSSEQIGEVKGELIVNLESIVRGHSKIAFGFAHLLLGPSWTFSENAATLRSAAVGKGNFNSEIKSTIKGAPKEMRQMFKSAENDTDRHHLIAILPYENNLYVIVSLFGGNAGSYMFNIGKISDTFQNELIKKSALFLDPKSKQAEWFGLKDIL